MLLVAGKLADRERAAGIRAEHERAGADTTLTGQGSRPVGRTVSTTWRRISVLASVLVVAMAVLTTIDVVRIGTTGAEAVWQGVVKN